MYYIGILLYAANFLIVLFGVKCRLRRYNQYVLFIDLASIFTARQHSSLCKPLY